LQKSISFLKISKNYTVEKRMAPEIVSSGAFYYVEKDLLFYYPKHLPFLLYVLGERRTNNRKRITEKNEELRDAVT